MLQGPAVTMVRRHTRGQDRLHYGPALQTVSGNYVAAKRKGVVDGVDYGFTGAVRCSKCDNNREGYHGAKVYTRLSQSDLLASPA